jgi:nucleoside 2-deoxyribosyltransferase
MKFYLAMNYSNGGIQTAKKLAPELEKLTGDQCTSRWHHSEAHEHHEFRKTIACTDVSDVARADYVIVAPLTETSRGSHVEMGLALGLDKPVYLYRPEGMSGTGFDSLCNDWKPEWVQALKNVIEIISQEGGKTQ